MCMNLSSVLNFKLNELFVNKCLKNRLVIENELFADNEL